MNEDMTDAMPCPNFAPRSTNPDSDMGLCSDTLAPPGGPGDLSDDSEFIKSVETCVPKITQLATIAKNSGAESEPGLSKKARVPPKRIILEETDSDGFSPQMKNWIPKSKQYSSGDESEPEVQGSVAAESRDMPPLERNKVAKVSDVNKE